MSIFYSGANMRKIIATALLPFFLLAVSPYQVCLSERALEFQGPPTKTLSPEAKAKLKELQQAKDLIGVIRLWEAEESPVMLTSEQDFDDVLFSFPRADFVPALVEGMKSENKFVARRCLIHLALLHEKAGEDYLLGLMLPEPLPDAQAKQAQQLVKELAVDDAEKRANAEKALIALGPNVADFLRPFEKNDDEKIASGAKKITAYFHDRIQVDFMACLKDIKDPRTLKALRAVVADPKLSPEILSYATHVLGEMGTPQDAALVRPLLKSDNQRITESAIIALGYLKDRESVPDLIALLKRKDTRNAVFVARALAEIGDERAIEPLDKHISAEKDEYTRVEFAYALAAFGKRDYLDKFLQNLKPGDSAWYRIVSCNGNIRGHIDAEATKAIIKALPQSKDDQVVQSAVYSLVRQMPRGDKTFIEIIRTARKDMKITENHYLREINPRLSAMLIMSGDAEEEKAILANVDSDNLDLRGDAYQIMAMVRDMKYIPILIKACDDKELRHYAVSAISTISGEYFIGFFNDPASQMAEINAWYKKYLEQNAPAKPDSQK